MARLQELYHDGDHDYEAGSPHLRHNRLRREMIHRLRLLVLDQFERTARCRVLEIGAGHGGFTDHLVATGAQLTITEMSRPSLDLLERRLRWNPSVRFIYDSDGETVFRSSGQYDVVVCVSVLHHIPDYLGFVDRLLGQIAPGGGCVSFQDPLWYPRRRRLNRMADRGAYYAWRITQQNLRQGVSTRLRRLRGIYDEDNELDMVEYHVVRSGVDEEALEALLRDRFRSVEQWRYWSTQSPTLQALGTHIGIQTSFGLIAQGLNV